MTTDSPLEAASPPTTTPTMPTLIRTPDQRVRVFVSSTLDELAPERAGRLLGAASRLLPATSSYREELHRRSAAARTQLDAATFEVGWMAGQAMTEEQAITEALQGA